MHSLAACAAVLALVPVALQGQVIPGRPITRQECQAALAALAAGARDGSGWERLDECGADAGRALAIALRGARSESDSTYLNTLWRTAGNIRDPNVLAAALDVAGDRGAAQAVRVVSLFVALSQYDNVVTYDFFRLSWRDLVTVPLGQWCRFIWPTDMPEHGSEVRLPRDYLQQIAAVTDRIAEDEGDAPVVRDLARCVRTQISDEVPETIDPRLIVLTYVCGNTFRVENRGNKTIQVSYEVRGSADRGEFSVPPRGERVTTVDDPGTMRLFYLGKLVQSVANAGTPCPGD